VAILRPVTRVDRLATRRANGRTALSNLTSQVDERDDDGDAPNEVPKVAEMLEDDCSPAAHQRSAFSGLRRPRMQPLNGWGPAILSRSIGAQRPHRRCRGILGSRWFG
jgi:hypothetical protein